MTLMSRERIWKMGGFAVTGRLMPALILFIFFMESMPAFALSNGWPVPFGTVTSTIGWRKDPFGSGRIKWHNGIDIAVPLNTPVTPTGTGMVRFAGWHEDYGWLVVVDHHDGWFTMYGHNCAVAVKVGQEVTPETVISYAGSTGRSTGVHVHFERRWFPEGTTPAPAVAEMSERREYPDGGIQQSRGAFEQSAGEIGQSLELPLDETGEPSLVDDNSAARGGLGGE